MAGSGELVQHNRCDQAGGADEAQQLQQSEGFAGCGGDVLRSHEAFLKIGKSEMVHGSEVSASRLAQTSACQMSLSLLDRPEFPTGWRWIRSPPGGKPTYESATSPACSETAATIAATAEAPKKTRISSIRQWVAVTRIPEADHRGATRAGAHHLIRRAAFAQQGA